MVGQKSFDLGPPLHLSKKYKSKFCYVVSLFSIIFPIRIVFEFSEFIVGIFFL